MEDNYKQQKELKHRLPIKRLHIEWPILNKKGATDHDVNKDNIIHVSMSALDDDDNR